MKTLRLVCELTYDEVIMHDDDAEGKRWFYEEVLGKELILYSTEIGDEVGEIKVLTYNPI